MDETKKLHRIEDGVFDSHFPEKTHIFFRSYFPKEELAQSAYHVIFQHGMIEYHKRHEDLFNALRRKFGNRLLISCMDLYGHGKSGGDRGYINEFGTFVEDFKSFLSIMFHRYYMDKYLTPIFISHSLGGLVTLKALSDELNLPAIEPKLCVFVNPCLKPKLKLPKEATNLLESLPETLAKVRVPLIYDAYDLSQDESKAREFVTDHLISKSITIKLGIETLRATKDINSVSYFFNYPSLFLLSGDDRIVENEKSELFFTGMDKSISRKVEFPTMRHDLLNETCRTQAFEEIIKDIEKMEL